MIEFLNKYSPEGNACWNLFILSVYFQLASPQCNKCSDNMVLMIHWVSQNYNGYLSLK